MTVYWSVRLNPPSLLLLLCLVLFVCWLLSCPGPSGLICWCTRCMRSLTRCHLLRAFSGRWHSLTHTNNLVRVWQWQSHTLRHALAWWHGLLLLQQVFQVQDFWQNGRKMCKKTIERRRSKDIRERRTCHNHGQMERRGCVSTWSELGCQTETSCSCNLFIVPFFFFCSFGFHGNLLLFCPKGDSKGAKAIERSLTFPPFSLPHCIPTSHLSLSKAKSLELPE